jgi:hypothetical protein
LTDIQTHEGIGNQRTLSLSRKHHHRNNSNNKNNHKQLHQQPQSGQYAFNGNSDHHLITSEENNKASLGMLTVMAGEEHGMHDDNGSQMLDQQQH